MVTNPLFKIIVVVVALYVFPLAFATSTGDCLTLSIYNNSGLSGPGDMRCVSSQSLADGATIQVGNPLSVEMLGSVQLSAQTYLFKCSFEKTQLAFVWIDDHLVCQDGNAYSKVSPSYTDNPLPIKEGAAAVTVRVVAWSGGDASHMGNMVIRISMSVDSAASQPLPPFSSLISPEQIQRYELQKNLMTGWGTWLTSDITTMAHLPSGAALTFHVCLSKNDECLDRTLIDSGNSLVRVGPHAIDGSFIQLFAALNSPTTFGNGNFSIAFSGNNDDLRVSIGSMPGTNASDYYLKVTGRFAWFRAGTITLDTGAIAAAPFGLPALRLAVLGNQSSVLGTQGLKILFDDSGSIYLSTVPSDTEMSVKAYMQQVEASEYARYQRYGANADVAMAIQAAIMWNLIYTPSEAGPIVPVSRSWDFTQGPVSPDLSYVEFDWDNIFNSLIIATFANSNDSSRSSVVAKQICYSNFIQIIKSRTAAGFVPNFSAGGYKSQDRTEPPVGAKVLLDIHNKLNDTWIVSLLYDDLKAWNDWFMRRRVLRPHNLIALGSWDEQAVFYNTTTTTDHNNMQDARYESGLDNSPMYDGEFFDDKDTHLMQLYDVGMSSLVAGETKALMQLAKILKKPDDQVAELEQRYNTFQKMIQSHLWDDQLGLFVNKFSANDTFYRRISPTSFYGLLAEAATDAQAINMTKSWLLSKDHFCVSIAGDMSGNDDACYWGLPSIQYQDPAFPPQGYWRGYVWGPMALITTWSLEAYSHLDTVSQAKRALAAQMKSLMLSQWNLNRHICENFSPHRVSTECTGTKFYTWGALTGLLAIKEDGQF